MELISRSMPGRLFAVYQYSRNWVLATLTPINNGVFCYGFEMWSDPSRLHRGYLIIVGLVKTLLGILLWRSACILTVYDWLASATVLHSRNALQCSNILTPSSFRDNRCWLTVSPLEVSISSSSAVLMLFCSTVFSKLDRLCAVYRQCSRFSVFLLYVGIMRGELRVFVAVDVGGT